MTGLRKTKLDKQKAEKLFPWLELWFCSKKQRVTMRENLAVMDHSTTINKTVMLTKIENFQDVLRNLNFWRKS